MVEGDVVLIKKVTEIFKVYGIHSVGFCDFEWIKHELLSCRASLRIPQHCNTVMVCISPYRLKREAPHFISRYAAVEDYHKILSEKLQQVATKLKEIFPENQFEVFVDNSPVPEVKAAALAGLGVVGENHLLITKEYGSYVFIGEILTDLKIQTVKHNITKCIGCDRCKTACPTGRLLDPACRCLSDITQQKKDLSAREEAWMRENQTVWGCDICQEICPMNQNKKLSDVTEFKNTYRDTYQPGEDPTNRAYAWRGEKVIMRNYEIIKKFHSIGED